MNDRSLKGDGDSEIAIVVEDTDMIESRMDGKPVCFSSGRYIQVYLTFFSIKPQDLRLHLGERCLEVGLHMNCLK